MDGVTSGFNGKGFPSVSALLERQQFNSVTLARVLGCSDKTAMKRLRNPELLTIGELRMIAEYRAVPESEFDFALVSDLEIMQNVGREASCL